MPAQEKVFRNAGWLIKTVHGPIMGDKEGDAYRRLLSAIVLPEMVFHQNRVELVHEASGVVISLNAFDALAGWRHEDLPPLQVRVAEEWRKAREHEIQQQGAVQLTYDWTFTTPYTCTVVPPPPPPGSAPSSGAPASGAPASGAPAASFTAHITVIAPGAAAGADAAVDGGGEESLRHHPRGVADFVCGGSSGGGGGGHAPGTAAAATAAQTAHSAEAGGAPTTSPSSSSSSHAAPSHAAPSHPAAPAAPRDPQPHPQHQQQPPQPQQCYCQWAPTADAIDRGLLMERDPILFYDEVPLYESDLDDNGVCAVTVKLRVMPRCWLVLLRCWVRVDGSLVRLRESRLFSRHDMRSKAHEILQEVRYCEGGFKDLRRSGAPDEGPAYQDADAAAQVFQAVAPVGLQTLQLRKLLLPPAQSPAGLMKPPQPQQQQGL